MKYYLAEPNEIKIYSTIVYNKLCLFFSVFWDLYCAAPERRDTCDHSSEAKAFHDYGFVNSGYGSNGLHVSFLKNILITYS